MIDVDWELDRVLSLLRSKIREYGYTQLQVQDELEWGRSYISQLLTKQKALRIEQVLLILDVIKVDPMDFFAELYSGSEAGSGSLPTEYAPEPGKAPYNADDVRSTDEPSGVGRDRFRQSRALLLGLVSVLVDQEVVDFDELARMTKDFEGTEDQEPVAVLESRLEAKRS